MLRYEYNDIGGNRQLWRSAGSFRDPPILSRENRNVSERAGISRQLPIPRPASVKKVAAILTFIQRTPQVRIAKTRVCGYSYFCAWRVRWGVPDGPVYAWGGLWREII